ncbi:MAG: ABC transporter permease subunit [Bacillota bacterium]|jgi:ABC-type transport system involved in multi-copper enzyme maturation permease subunit|nr:ABC transporter permease subunit [Bacillota bacterium]
MMKALYFKELLEVRWKLIIVLLITVIVAVPLPFMFDLFKSSVHMFTEDLFMDIPMLKIFQQQIEAQASSFNLYLWANWYGKNLPQMILVLAAVIGGPMLAGESASGTFRFLLSKPISRRQVFLAKYAAGATATAVLSVVSTIALLISTKAAGQSVGVLWFLAPQPAQILGGLCLLSIALWLSARIDDSVVAGVVAVGVGIALAIVDSFGPLKGRLIFGLMAESRSLTTGVPNPVSIVILAVVAGLIGYDAFRAFRKKDL